MRKIKMQTKARFSLDAAKCQTQIETQNPKASRYHMQNSFKRRMIHTKRYT
jgi:hypothetical protein